MFGKPFGLMAVEAAILNTGVNCGCNFPVISIGAQHFFKIKYTIVIQTGFQHAGRRNAKLVA